MSIEIIAIGNEVLRGATLNTNGAFISQKLILEGYSISSHRVLPDDEEGIFQNLSNALLQCPIVIATGGLGPTKDDVTKKAVARLFASPLVFHESWYEILCKRYPPSEALREQSYLPQKAHFFENSIGTAMGMAFQEKEKCLILLPGVPLECKEMFEKSILPFLLKHYPIAKKRIFSEMNFCLIPETFLDEFLKKKSFNDPSIEVGIYPYYGCVRLYLSCPVKNEKVLRKIEESLKETFKNFLFSEEGKTVQQVLQKILCEKNQTLALSESCTGGAMAASLARNPGASKFFLGGVVAYANEVKENVLGVSPKTLREKGAVSVETVREMVLGTFNKFSSSYAIAISGTAGPAGATSTKPVGTVCIGIGERGKEVFTKTLLCHGNREAIIEGAVNAALGMLWQLITQGRITLNG